MPTITVAISNQTDFPMALLFAQDLKGTFCAKPPEVIMPGARGECCLSSRHWYTSCQGSIVYELHSEVLHGEILPKTRITIVATNQFLGSAFVTANTNRAVGLSIQTEQPSMHSGTALCVVHADPALATPLAALSLRVN
eukprot:TRINITY_DN3332_c0_g2_i24.p1 TRINITY_DN3332_c0_g2~~TRINITY_DN3332_c0_g2_i24.p1  ORF type:complete len:139 (+),score=5.00 TRINITY_DN3332_c0_g2_i24:1734-2150(+)